MNVRIPYAAIDWVRTAETNGLSVPVPVLVNHIRPALDPVRREEGVRLPGIMQPLQQTLWR